MFRSDRKTEGKTRQEKNPTTLMVFLKKRRYGRLRKKTEARMVMELCGFLKKHQCGGIKFILYTAYLSKKNSDLNLTSSPTVMLTSWLWKTPGFTNILHWRSLSSSQETRDLMEKRRPDKRGQDFMVPKFIESITLDFRVLLPICCVMKYLIKSKSAFVIVGSAWPKLLQSFCHSARLISTDIFRFNG